MQLSKMKNVSKSSPSKVMDAIEKKRTKCEIYTRVMWYHRPVSSYNIWKKSEFYSRKYFETDANESFNKEYA